MVLFSKKSQFLGNCYQCLKLSIHESAKPLLFLTHLMIYLLRIYEKLGIELQKLRDTI